MLGEKTNVDKATSVGNYLNLYFGQNQGLRLGESTVVSCKVHGKMPKKRVKGQIQIFTNRDAGKSYLDYVETGQVVHIDVYHQPGEIDPCKVGKALFWSIYKYFMENDPQLKYAEDECFKMVTSYANKVFITTNQGKGLLYDLFQDIAKPFLKGEEGYDHVHILARLNREEYYLVYIMAEAAEEQIITSGLNLSKVRNIIHGTQKQERDSYAEYIKLPWKNIKGQNAYTLSDKENVNQLILKLAEKLGGVDEIEQFMENYSTNIFKRKGIEQQRKKWGDVEHDIDQLTELGLIKDSVFGKVLTKKGLRLKDFIVNHKCELETEIRRKIRGVPSGGRGQFKKLSETDCKASQVIYINRNRTINDPDKKWSGDLAVPETIIQAKKNSILRGDQHFTIKKQDLHFYDKKIYVPIDICLLIDASGSMAGDKRQAACFLAEHLLITGREKVAVVTFQERSSSVVVPFTRNQRVLSKGLATIVPAGLSPLANGIMNSVELIKNNQVKNPLLVLITDGIPNTPLWTTDAKADALKAATYIKDNKINMICIGVESNRSFLEKLTQYADAALYLVDDLNKDNLINIVRLQKNNMIESSKRMA
jgi:magnesium chelatase subunit D